MRAFFIVVALLAGCAQRGEPLPAWTLDDAPLHARTVELPANSATGSLPREEPYTLRSQVSLAEVQRGQPMTLAFECFHGELALRANGSAIENIGDVDAGEHRFVIPAEHTRAGALALELDVISDSLSLGFGVAPHLVVGEVRRPSTVAMFNRQLAIIDLTIIAVFVVLFGISFALDRRRVQDLAFAAGVASASVAPLAALGVFRDVGVLAGPLISIGICGTNVAVIYFVHASFRLERPPRYLLVAFGVLALLAPVTAIAAPISMAWSIAMSLADLLFFRHVVLVLWRQRKGPRRVDALLLATMMVLVIVIVSPDLLGFAFGYSLMGGLHTMPAGAIGFGIAQALHLAREQVNRQRELEHTADELRRQVAERSRELSVALGKLAQSGVTLDENRTIDGRYRVVKKLGQGGMGAVYEVERTSDGKRFALKTLRGRADTDLMARFAREAQIAAEISHPHLVPVLDVGIADGGLFLVMPLVAGGSLEHARKQYGDVAWAKPLLAQIADGLAALHARDIVHRDLKPANILLADGKARIADFGLAALRADTLGETLPSSDALADTAAMADTAAQGSPLTRRGDLFGTPAYMAPELAAGVEDAKPSSDIFAFGMIAYELLTGRQAFAEPPVIARLHGRVIETPKPDGVPSIIARCLDLDPSKRPTAAELVSSPIW